MTPAPTFDGFVRGNGRAGTRNHIGVFIAGNCAATVARNVAEWFTPKRLAPYPNVDGVVPFIHEFGCGMEKSGEPMDLLRRTLGGGIRNPNVAGTLVLALGCERNNVYAFLEQEGLQAGPLLKTVVLQEVGGTAKAIEAGIAAIETMLPLADAARRQPVPVGQLVVGLQAAGDDTDPLPAQAALGAAVDMLVANGGTAIVSGTTTAGPALAARAASDQVADAVAARIDWWRNYTAGRDTRGSRGPHRHPSDGDLPHTGSSALRAVVGYAHAVHDKGLVLMDSPHYEAISASGQVAAGANLVCVLTSCGSALAAPAVPTVRLAATGDAFACMQDDFDLDCSSAASGTETIAAAGRRIFEAWLAHASGRRTKGEDLGIDSDAFVPWPIGVLA